MATHDGVEQLPQLAAAPPSSANSIDEKADARPAEKHTSSDSSLEHSKLESAPPYYDDDDQVQYVNGEPVISSGKDVSRFLVDPRDDGDPAITFRSLFIGTIFAGLGAALCQVRRNSDPIVRTVSDLRHLDCRYTCSSPSRCLSPRSSSFSLSTVLVSLGPSTYPAKNGSKALASPVSGRSSTS